MGFPLRGSRSASPSCGDAGGRAGREWYGSREALLKYDPWKSPTGDVLRPVIAQERVTRGPDGLVSPFGDHEARRLGLKKAFADGTVAVDMTRFVIPAACELAVGKEADDEKGTLVRALRKKHTSRPSTQAALAAALTSYLNAATALAGHLEALPTFPMDMLGEARTLVDGLLGDSKGTAKQHTRALRLRRNRILSVLQRRVRKAREVGRFAFRDHPEVLRKVASEALRERRGRTAGHAETDGGNDTAPAPNNNDVPS